MSIETTCPVCGHSSTGVVVIARLEMKEATDWALCAAHLEMYDQGFVALVEAKDTSTKSADGTLKPQDAVRTGRICHVKQDTLIYLFGMKYDPRIPLIFVVPGVIDNINRMVAENMARKPK
jgi:hypothetical protein